MIYFLDNSLQLQKIVTSKNINSAVHEHELNGLIRGDIELDLSYANKFLVLGIDHVGYYYKDEFYLHKIQRVEYDHVNETATVVLRHIFFEDMIFGPIIKDVRPKNQDAVTILRQTIEANTRWQIVMTDVTGTLSTNFYWQVPYEVIEFVNKNFRVDMFPKILFDGKNINGFQLHVKNASSSEVKQRIPFGSRVLDLKYEEDFSEIVTKLVGHGKGEEVGDGYGRRINFSEIDFNRNGVKSPVGSVYMEDPSVTSTYGNDGQTPREGRVVFEDIESPSELAEATYQHYLDVSRPQMLFTADVADIGDVSIGDSVLIVRREYDVYFKARIHKLSVNLLNPEDAQVELGDYEHFKESKVERKSREKNNRVQKQLSDRIARLKREANAFIDGEFSQAISEFEQNLIDQKAQVKADFVRMEDKIEGTRTEFTDNLNAEITQTKEYAEKQAQEKSEEVRTNLETVTSGHKALIDSLKDNVLDIDTFLGDKSKTLAKQFAEMETGLNQSITAEAGRIDAIVTNFGDSGKSLAQFVLDVDSIETTVAKNDDWLGTYGSAAEQTIAGFEQKVWQSDLQNPNLIPMSDVSNQHNGGGAEGQWFAWNVDRTGSFQDYMIVRSTNSSTNMGMRTPVIGEYVQPGQTYTLSWEVGLLHSQKGNMSGAFNYNFIYGLDSGNYLLPTPTRTLIESDSIQELYKYVLTFVMPQGIKPTTRILIGDYVSSGVDISYRFRRPKLEQGNFATPFNSSFSMLEQRTDKLALTVQDLTSIAGQDIITQSDIQIKSNEIILGSMILGPQDIASIISISPSAIDMITENLNLTGNLNAKGKITTIAVDAIEGNFARLFANQLTTNVITSDHIQVTTTLIDKMFATSARIDQLITKTHFVNEMHALTLNVVDLNASQIRTRLLSANTIEATWLKSGTALLDRVFASTAMFERMMAKSAFVTTLSTITLDLHELTIWRPDGVAMIQNGLARYGTPVPIVRYLDDGIETDDKTYWTNLRTPQTVGIAYGEHAGRWYNLSVGMGLRWDSDYVTQYCKVRIEPADAFTASVANATEVEITARRNEGLQWQSINVPLLRPTYRALTFYIQIYRRGENVYAPVEMRYGRSWVSDDSWA